MMNTYINSTIKNEFKFQSVFSNITNAEKIANEIITKIQLNEEIYGNILLTLSEAINNAIVHGNKFNPEKIVTVRYYLNNKELNIEVIDQGEGFDVSKVPDPTKPENIENLYGRGVFIIISLSDKVEFEYNKGQIVRIKFII